MVGEFYSGDFDCEIYIISDVFLDDNTACLSERICGTIHGYWRANPVKKTSLINKGACRNW